MFFAKGTPDLMQRLPCLPTTPHVAFLLCRKPKPFPRLHKHHLLKTALYKMVLHRPSEPAAEIGQVASLVVSFCNGSFQDDFTLVIVTVK
jgi:hypothetical protein